MVMANSFQKDRYGSSLWDTKAWWDDDFISRDPKFRDLAYIVKSKFDDADKIIDDLSDGLVDILLQDISEFMIYVCTLRDSKPDGKMPDYARLIQLNERLATWYSIVEQLIVSKQVGKSLDKFPIESSLPKDGRYESLSNFLVMSEFKWEKFTIVYPSNEILQVALTLSPAHRFLVQPSSQDLFFSFWKVNVDDSEMFEMSYQLSIPWNDVLEHFSGWLRKLANAVSLTNSMDFTAMQIAAGENKKTEFKSTLCFDLKERKRMYRIEHSVLKTVAAFLNSDGGVLFIGIADDKTVHGLDDDFSVLHKQGDLRDEFNKAFDNLINNGFGRDLHSVVKLIIEPYQGKLIAKVVVGVSLKPVFLNNRDRNSEEFYVRSNASSILLSGSELLDYVRHHFRN